ncbi:DUF6701 domain-containing protein [Photobacterium kishitanii]|uniref:DUF6701 domain-containing protein n=1 Tax=Photobacterium kishitanii TaxID=318456 RepID=A0A2T3KCR9_9GAMM|nr:DUF6701 domain-containing protein [Photobacterium kishitanii]PSU93570.1 hypothetical protein C9J27_20960 [Photobacterium kishitanii]
MKFITMLSGYVFFMMVSFAAVSEPVFDFGQYTVKQQQGCIENDCEIILEKNFTHKPLVFLMPTITENGLDAPSSLKITTIYKKTTGKYAFKVRQVYPLISDKIELEDGDEFEPDDDLESDKDLELYKIPMMKIAYFAMEEGEIALGNKGRILAAKKEIRHNLDGSIKSLYKNQMLKKGSADQLVKNGKLISIPLPDKFNNPGAIVEVQPSASIHDDNSHIEKNWFTPLMLRNNDSSNNDFGDFYLGVDSSETGAVLNKKLMVGYLLVEGSGFHRGLQFALGSAATPNTLKEEYSGNELVTQPVLDQCQGFTTLKNTNFDFSDQQNNPILFVASKNSRFGSNGGWVRLCQVETNAVTKQLQVSFVNDEDLNENKLPERKHANEEVGFMAFQRRVAEEVCNVFPGPVQTWQDSGGKFEGSEKVNIKGAPFVGDRYRLGFNSIISSYAPNDYCNGQQCFTADGNPKLYAQKMLLPTWPEKDDGDFSVDKIKPEQKEYWFKTLYLYKNTKVNFPIGTKLHLQDLDLNNGAILAAETVFADDLQIFIHGVNGPINRPSITLSKGSKLHALIYSERHISMSNGNNKDEKTIITGAVTAPAILMTGNKNNRWTEIIGQTGCFDAQPEYQLAITPTVATSTLCEPQKIEFLVSQAGASKSDFKGDISFSISSATGGKWARNVGLNNATSFGVGTSTFVLKESDSRSVIWLQPNGAETVTVTASIANMVGEQPSGKYSFIPGGFSVTPTTNNIIAGQPFSVTVKAVACANSENINDSVIEQYSGSKSLQFKTEYLAPKIGQFKVGVVSDNTEVEQLNVDFTNGVSEVITMRYRDAGELALIVNDADCTRDTCSLIESKSKHNKRLLTKADLPQGLSGKANLKSRPWTFAMCPQVGDSFTGTATNGDGLVAAGEAFVVRAKPLQWQAGDSLNNPIDVTNKTYCQRPITPNFFANGAPITTLTASIAGIDTPANGHRGELSGTVAQPNSGSHDKVAMIFNNLRWSEVGSVALKMTANSYLGMTINPSQRAIGRFYPKQLVITDSVITNAHTESSPFTYMDQAFTANVTVEAQNVIGEPTFNYGEFAPQLKETLLLTAVDLNPQTSINDLSSRLDQANLANDWQQQWQQAQLTITNGALTFKRLPKNGTHATVKMTTADGPYEVGLGLSVQPRSQCSTLGCTDFIAKTLPLRGYNTSQAASIAPLTGQVSSRYGRMVLQDVNGVFDKPLTMPLKVQYWNGEQFIINSDDSRSRFNSQWSCKQIIYTSKPHDKASLVATNNSVSQGQNNSLQVLPGIGENEAYIKQQLRFWLRIAAQPASNIGCTEDKMANQPWLTFNWRGVGDEDPSGLVTFGSYRGNDRIIYRAEKGLNQPIE